jgi:hypothetical protein
MKLPFEFIQQLRETFKGQWLYVNPNGLIVNYDDPEKLLTDIAPMIVEKQRQEDQQKREE